MPNNTQIRHAHLKVVNIQRSVDFYCCLFISWHSEILFREKSVAVFLCHRGVKLPAGKSGKHSTIAGGDFCGHLYARNVRI